jgi:hypothetical protein
VIKISKTKLTLELEKAIWQETNKQGTFGCFEVTIGWWGKERVDYMTYNTKGEWRCYEIKISKSDFHSKAKKTFIGHYNYYVMPEELYEQVKEEIPDYIGVYCGRYLKKKPKKQELKIDNQTLLNSMIRSLSRENTKFIKTGDTSCINRLKNRINNLEKESRKYRSDSTRYSNAIYMICDKYKLDHKEVRELVRNMD